MSTPLIKLPTNLKLKEKVWVEIKVIIAGAGPSGCVAAYELARQKIPTLLMEREEALPPKISSGIMHYNTLQQFPDLAPFVGNLISKLDVFSPNGQTTIQLENSTPLFGMVDDPSKFNEFLLTKAQTAGAIVRMGISIENVQKFDTYTRLKISPRHGNAHKHYFSNILIGADSFPSTVARNLQLRDVMNPMNYGLRIMAEYPLNETDRGKFFSDPHHGKVAIGFLDFADYGWVLPKIETVSVGLQTPFQDSRQIRAQFAQYLSFLKKKHAIPDSFLASKALITAFSHEPPAKDSHSNRTLLIGKAGGFTSPINCDDLYLPMMSGQLAAEACKKAVETKNPAFWSMDHFYTGWKKYLGKRFDFYAKVREIFFEFPGRSRKLINWFRHDARLLDIFKNLLQDQDEFFKPSPRLMLTYYKYLRKEKRKGFEIPEEDREFQNFLRSNPTLPEPPSSHMKQ